MAFSCFISQGLADALLGQGKTLEANKVLQQAGLTKKGKIPASYLRWLNKVRGDGQKGVDLWHVESGDLGRCWLATWLVPAECV